MNIPGWILVLLLFLTGFFMFGTATGTEVATVEAPPVMVTQEVEINGNPGVILPAGSGEGWTPEDADLQAAEDAVSTFRPVNGPEPVLEGYRQYTGVIEDGERKIHILSMCTELDGWREHPVGVDDGGPCFWEATYNVDTGEMEHLVVNGEA